MTSELFDLTWLPKSDYFIDVNGDTSDVYAFDVKKCAKIAFLFTAGWVHAELQQFVEEVKQIYYRACVTEDKKTRRQSMELIIVSLDHVRVFYLILF